MEDVIVFFESEKKEGIVAVGTYLMDAAKRLGVTVLDGCRSGEDVHQCSMTIGKGRDLLSPPTATEREQLSSSARKSGKRLSCQTKIEKAGEISIMTVEKEKEAAKETTEKTSSEEYRKEFEELPLEKKIASLVELEAIALGETFSYVINSPSAVVGKVMDVMSEFGLDLEKKDREAKRPEEHKEAEADEAAPAEGSSATPAKESASKKDAEGGKKRKRKKPAGKRGKAEEED